MTRNETLERARHAIHEADALLIGAGAGMGVDSGLPDFRGNEGFWRAYPPLRRLGVRFDEMANPRWFSREPALAWGFYGHRLGLYRETGPHPGFAILRGWAERMGLGCFVFTSNVDGHFQRAGFEGVLECHGSIHHLQCTRLCTEDIWSAKSERIEVDEETFRAEEPLPRCPRCGALARPNVLMFGDSEWLPSRSAAQERTFQAWLSSTRDAPLVVVELGAGLAVPTVRWVCERVVSRENATLIRVNPRDPEGPPGTLSIASGALEALQALDAGISG